MPEIKVPSEFEDAGEFVAHCRKEFTADLEADRENRKADLEDKQFLAGKQWPDWIQQKREAAGKPVMTINRMPAFVAQVLGNRRLNETTIKVAPDNGGTKEVAAIREGLIRSIQKNSRAQIAYNAAMQNQVSGGIGNFMVQLDYAYDDVFEQDISIVQIPNSQNVVWDRLAIDPTGRDADHVYVYDHMPRATFTKKYPKATPSDMVMDGALLQSLRADGWVRQDDVRIASRWQVSMRTRKLALFQDGTTKYVDDKPEAEWLPFVVRRPDGSPIVRDADCKYAEMYLMSGTDILEGPYELPISRVPVFRVPGWELYVGEERHRWGLVRFLKDSQRYHNYQRSTVAEKMALTQKAPWVASDIAVQGREKEWRNAHLSDDMLLIYNAEAALPPQRTPPVQLEIALSQEASTAAQDMKDVSNLHEASLGIQSNEVSGKAIIARQRVGELGTILYQDNVNLAMEECGRVMNELISYVYDTARVIKTLGADDKPALVAVNTGDPLTDLTAGKYSITVVTGLSTVTKRVEAAEGMMNLINAAPQVMAVAADKIVEAQDWPGAEEISRRLRSGLPPGTLSPDDLTPQEQQQQAQAAQQQAMAMQVQVEATKAALDKALAEVEEIRAKTQLLLAQANKAAADPPIKAATAHSKAQSLQFNDHMRAIEHADNHDSGVE